MARSRDLTALPASADEDDTARAPAAEGMSKTGREDGGVPPRHAYPGGPSHRFGAAIGAGHPDPAADPDETLLTLLPILVSLETRMRLAGLKDVAGPLGRAVDAADARLTGRKPGS